MKDEYDALNPQRQPGPLAEALGARVEQYYALEKPVELYNPDHPGAPATKHERIGAADTWAEALTVTSPQTQVNAVYADPGGWLDGKAAVVSRSLGKGRIDYLGTLPDSSYMSLLLAMAADSKVRVLGGKDVEVCTRSGPNGAVRVYINHSQQSQTVDLPEPMRDVLRPGKLPLSSLTLPAQDVAVLVPERNSQQNPLPQK